MSEGVELSTVGLSHPSLELSLSASPQLFVSSTAISQLTNVDILERVQSGEIWFLPPRVFYIQIIIRFDDCDMSDAPMESHILEFLAGAICLSKLWEILGISIGCSEIRYHTSSHDEPNLWFEVEHPDKSSALLSPPDAETCSMDGIVCYFEYKSSAQQDNAHYEGHDNDTAGQVTTLERVHVGPQDRLQDARRSPGPLYVEDQSCAEHMGEMQIMRAATALDQARQHRRGTADLAIAALHSIIGVRRKLPNIRIDTSASPTLLEMAPSVWNAHYMKADIITASGGWRSSLREKIDRLLADERNRQPDNWNDREQSASKLVQKRLWEMLKKTLMINIGIKSAAKNVHRDSQHLVMEELESQLYPEVYGCRETYDGLEDDVRSRDISCLDDMDIETETQQMMDAADRDYDFYNHHTQHQYDSQDYEIDAINEINGEYFFEEKYSGYGEVRDSTMMEHTPEGGFPIEGTQWAHRLEWTHQQEMDAPPADTARGYNEFSLVPDDPDETSSVDGSCLRTEQYWWDGDGIPGQPDGLYE
ncbi:uncharacterized protein JN550_007179 [Neoarthrinium moseri]|uniref:uncharacterized protein n=1 Tax=Neoarthrinium moseri TaxID=1658444 RepID=UPI001FDD3B9E|nr:uncharacterized protein JN550_007179 [Neoarthrinium moseri]KAI1867127.1 hypothetical protein JN550_007179 [Neoarthrinium moseri]